MGTLSSYWDSLAFSSSVETLLPPACLYRLPGIQLVNEDTLNSRSTFWIPSPPDRLLDSRMSTWTSWHPDCLYELPDIQFVYMESLIICLSLWILLYPDCLYGLPGIQILYMDWHSVSSKILHGLQVTYMDSLVFRLSIWTLYDRTCHKDTLDSRSTIWTPCPCMDSAAFSLSVWTQSRPDT